MLGTDVPKAGIICAMAFQPSDFDSEFKDFI